MTGSGDDSDAVFTGEPGEAITLIASTDTHDLRRRVLRTGTPDPSVVFADDDAVGTFHLATRRLGRIVAVSTWLERPYPDEAATPGFRLRGMAVEPELHGTGVGGRLLAAGLDEVGRRGGALVWAHARSTALGFYLQHGFESRGPEFTDVTTGLPHRVVIRRLR